MICTDGLIETGGHDLETGWRRLRAILEDHEGGMEELADTLVQAVHGPSSHHTTGPLADRREDDIAVLLLPGGRGLRLGAPGPAVRRTMLRWRRRSRSGSRWPASSCASCCTTGPSADQVDSAVLLLSETLTNVLVHTDADALLLAEVRGEPGDRRMRVEVTDTSDDLPSSGALANWPPRAAV
ncbi:magnesium or manganese-dependent protein phosphatase [Streptomyces badius]